VPPQDKYRECLLKQNEKKNRLLEEEHKQLFKPKMNSNSEQIVKGLENANANVEQREPSPNEKLLSTIQNLAKQPSDLTAATQHTVMPIKHHRPDTSKSFRKKKRQAGLSKSKSRENKSKTKLLADYTIDTADGKDNSISSPRLRKLTTEEIIKLDFRKSIEKVSRGS
jgi:hypothetical protein